MLKNENVPENFKSGNIDRAREKLDVLKMSEEKRKQYEKYLMSIPVEKDILETAEARGHMKGYKEGEQEKARKTAENLLATGKLTAEEIAQATGLSAGEVRELSKGGD
ncbi:MAG: hypothetical protein GY795_00850 [Desulfobacterales bacterium]|nr:hypothetical protein [Desulfobacterales bacterium]